MPLLEIKSRQVTVDDRQHRTKALPNVGRYGSPEAALAAVVSRLVAELDPQAIWLFGSRARGEAKPDSDFDLLVVAKQDGRFGSGDYERVLEPLRGAGVGCDVVPCSAEDFEAAARLDTTLVAEVLRSGRQVYAGQAGRRILGVEGRSGYAPA